MNKFYNENYARFGGHLGSIYPFMSIESPENFSFNMSDMIQFRKMNGFEVKLDKAALVEKACLPYLLGDRTLIEDVKRAPWMCSYSNQHWIEESLPVHGTEIPNETEFVSNLKKELLKEADGYVGNSRTIGILLSGGMDSRVVAGIVRELQQDSHNISVVGLTWGNSNSRDVIYSKRICQQFGWEFIHFPITAETLLNNIQLSAKMGAEISPFHYHAMGSVAKLQGIDVILGGSYGDSVGRAEFSGKHVTKLNSILPKNINRLGLIKSELIKATQQNIFNDAELPNHINTNGSQLRKHEIEQEYHYMRRMLQSCMHVVAEKTPFHQMFTAPGVFSLMWGIEPALRDNEWYSKLLNILPGNLLQIPWARTGKLYHLPKEEQDQYDKQYHQYGLWLRNDLKDEILSSLNSNSIRELGVFNEKSLDALALNWRSAKGVNNNTLDSVVSWFASLEAFIKDNELSPICKAGAYTLSDYYQYTKGATYGALYVCARNVMKK